jgi:hypothetical protein
MGFPAGPGYPLQQSARSTPKNLARATSVFATIPKPGLVPRPSDFIPANDLVYKEIDGSRPSDHRKYPLLRMS